MGALPTANTFLRASGQVSQGAPAQPRLARDSFCSNAQLEACLTETMLIFQLISIAFPAWGHSVECQD